VHVGPMRIAFVTPEYVTETAFSGGGLANYLHRVAHGLVARGHEAEIFTVSKKEDGTIEDDGVKVHRVLPEWKWFFRLNRFLGHGMPVTKGIIVECYSLRRRFLQRHHTNPFDIVQAPNFRASGLALTISSPVPVVTRVSSHSRLWDEAYGLERTRDLKMREWLENRAIRRSARVYAPSAFLAKTYTDELGFDVDVVRPPFFLEETERDFSAYERILKGLEYVLFVGAIGRLKGAFVLAETARDDRQLKEPKISCATLRTAFATWVRFRMCISTRWCRRLALWRCHRWWTICRTRAWKPWLWAVWWSPHGAPASTS